MNFRRSASAVLVVSAAVVVIACGDSGGDDKDQVVKTPRSYGSAIVNGKYGEGSQQDLIDGKVTANYEGTGNTPMLDSRQLDADLAKALTKQMSADGTDIFASVLCPEHIKRQANYSFTCDGTAVDSDATFTVDVEFTDDNGNYIYRSHL